MTPQRALPEATVPFAICLTKEFGDISGADLTIGKLYEVLGNERGCLRIVDDAHEDYLYPSTGFEVVRLAPESACRVREAMRRAHPSGAD